MYTINNRSILNFRHFYIPRPKVWVRAISIVFLFFASTTLRSSTEDPVSYLTAKDTLFITLDGTTGEKIFEHHIASGQTLYSLARFYGLNEEELYPYNPKLKSSIVGIGQIIRVPIPNAAIKRFKGADFKQWEYAPIMIMVKQGDNLFKIARTMFHMPVDSVMKWNNLSNTNIRPGQVLQIGWMSLGGVPDDVRNARRGAIDVRSKMLSAYFEKQKKSVEERGAACWNAKGNSKTDLYCLHRTAKVGSIVAVTSTMSNRTVYAKVIGKIPENAYGSETVVIVAPSVAKLLGAKDEKFFVKIRYTP